MIQTMLVILLLAVTLSIVSSSGCLFPSPAAGFTNKAYEGTWYEIGKIQTKGGAFFERNCVCTQLNISPTNEDLGEYQADNDCRESTVTGKWTNVTGSLHDEDLTKPGKWLETIYSSVNYTVISIGDDYAVEYDCGTSFGITNYCIHVMSRTREMDPALFESLIEEAEKMGLNTEGLPVKMTLQEGC